MNTNPLPPDYHIHTPLCKHASGMPGDYRRAASALGITEICLSDHSPEPSGYDAKHRMSLDQYPDYRRMVESVQDAAQPTVLIGLEADYFPGGERFLQNWLPKQKLDLVLGSVHYIKDWGFDNPDYRDVWASVDVKGVWKEYFGLVACMIATGLFDAIAHFDLPKKFGHRLPDKDMKELVQPLLDKVAEAGMGIEINTSGFRREVEEAYPSPLILSLMREREIGLIFGSDAHEPSQVGHRFQDAIALAREAGYTTFRRFRNRIAAPASL